MTQTTFETFNVSELLVTIQAVLSLSASRLTMPIVMNSCDILSHTVPFLNSGLFPKNILFCSRMFFWTYRERMTQTTFETFYVPGTFVTIQPVSVHLETRRPSCWTLATLCRTQLLSTSLHIASAILRLTPVTSRSI